MRLRRAIVHLTERAFAAEPRSTGQRKALYLSRVIIGQHPPLPIAPLANSLTRLCVFVEA